MGKEILTFWDIKIEKKKNFFYHHEISTVLKDVDIEKVLVFNKILSCEKKTINTLLVTCMMIIKLGYYI